MISFDHMRNYFGLLFLCLLSTQNVAGQDTTDYPAVRAVVTKLFDGMRNGDSTLVRSVFATDAVLFSTFTDKKGVPYVETSSVNDFIAAVGTPHEEKWDERIHDVEIRTDDGLAQVWAPYVFYLDNMRVHCGVNTFQLVRTTEGWKIQALTDSRRREPCN